MNNALLRDIRGRRASSRAPPSRAPPTATPCIECAGVLLLGFEQPARGTDDPVGVSTAQGEQRHRQRRQSPRERPAVTQQPRVRRAGGMRRNRGHYPTHHQMHPAVRQQQSHQHPAGHRQAPPRPSPGSHSRRMAFTSTASVSVPRRAVPKDQRTLIRTPTGRQCHGDRRPRGLTGRAAGPGETNATAAPGTADPAVVARQAEPQVVIELAGHG